MKKQTLLILSVTLLSFYCHFLNAQEIIDNHLLVRSSHDAIATFQTLDDKWLYTQWKNKLGVRKAYMGFNPTLTNFILGLENGANTFSIPTGKVGIGTTSPSEKLHVNGNILSNKLMLNDPNLTSDWNTIWQSGFYESLDAKNGPESNGWFWGLNMNHRSNRSTYKYNGQIAIKNSSTAPTMYFRSTSREGTGTWGKIIAEIGNKTIINGHVGIGTKTPDSGYRLTVKGNISAREVRVKSNAGGGADFVFENTYPLPTLKEVEQFITKNKHLPEIASAKEMKQNGVNIGEFQIQLLQKIEELTLYTIQQQKDLEAQQNINQSFEARLKALEAQLKTSN